MYYICNYCESKFTNKKLLADHIHFHMKNTNGKPKDNNLMKFNCLKCKKGFPSRVILNRHVKMIHVKHLKINKTKEDFKHECQACKNQFKYNCQLKYHIRKVHFNLVSHVPYCNTKGINQVWFERVSNTGIIVEIKKIEQNLLLIRRLSDNTAIKPTEMNRELIDLRIKYPTNSRTTKISCRICSKLCLKRELSQHFVDTHRQLLKKRCDDCKAVFKRPVNCILHVCRAKIGTV